jgi:hypothetical protein
MPQNIEEGDPTEVSQTPEHDVPEPTRELRRRTPGPATARPEPPQEAEPPKGSKDKSWQEPTIINPSLKAEDLAAPVREDEEGGMSDSMYNLILAAIIILTAVGISVGLVFFLK